MEVTSDVLLAALNHKVIADAFIIARSSQTGVLSVVGMSTEYATVYDGYKMSWLDMRVDAASSTATVPVNAGVKTLPVADGAKFRSGMQVSVEGSEEAILVESISGNNLTVVRGFGGTTSENIANGATITIDSVSREENSQAESDGIFKPEPQENYFQTMDTAVEMSRRALSTLQYGNTNDLNFQLGERLRQLSIQMDRALIRGRRATAEIEGKLRTFSGGLRFFLDQAGALTVDAGGAELTLELIQSLNAELVARGGTTNTIAVGIPLARKLNKLISANYSSKRLSDWSNDEGAVNVLPSDLPLLGSVNKIVIDTNLDDTELVVFDSAMITVKPMKQNNAGESGTWSTKDATLPGQDGGKVRILGDFAFEIRNSKTHMARLRNLRKEA